MPLAVTLLANISEIGEPVLLLRDRWKAERTRLLETDDNDKLYSVNVSIMLSLNSKRMRQCPAALHLLSILALLPDGAAPEALSDIMQLSEVDIGQAPYVLKAVSLAYQDHSRRLRVLSPIRAFIEEFHFPASEDYACLTQFYIALANQGYISQDDYLSTKRILGPEQGNITAILRLIMIRNVERKHTAAIATAVASYSRFLTFDIPNTDLLLELLVNPDVVADPRSAGPVNEVLGITLRLQAYHQEAEECYQGYDDDARSALEEAKLNYEALGDTGGILRCLWNLAYILLKQDDYDKAGSVLEEAKVKFEALDDTSGRAWCLVTLATS
jgi:tetratricopeptide (TPR) repeat protein